VRAATLIVLATSAGAAARAQQPPDGTTGSTTGEAPSAETRPADENYVLAAVNGEVVTVRDVLLEWRLEGRRNANPDRPLAPTVEDRRALAKDLVIDRLWVAHARDAYGALYTEFVTPRMIDEYAKDVVGALYDDAAIPADERELMRSKGEVRIAMEIALTSDPDYRRCTIARPEDVKRWYDAHPETHRVSAQVQLGRVLLSRENAKELYGEAAETLAQRLRQRAVELSSLEAAAKELAPGSYQPTKVYEIERETDLRDDVLQFARSAVAGELSAPVPGQASVMLFTLLTRQEGQDVPFEKAAPHIKKQIELLRCRLRSNQYFVVKILPEAFFMPQEMFDDEIEQFVPGYKERKARTQAGPGGER